VCGFNATAVNEYGMLYGEVLMFCTRVTCMKITSTCIHKGCVGDVSYSWLDHSHIHLKIIWILTEKAFVLTYAYIEP
jgi:hypothetical protein